MTFEEYLRKKWQEGTSVLAFNVNEYGVSIAAYNDPQPRQFVVNGDRVVTTTEPVKGDE